MTALTVIYSQDTKQAEDLLKQTAASDIETSTYHELVAWCERIGLDSVITSYSIHYTKLYDTAAELRVMRRCTTLGEKPAA